MKNMICKFILLFFAVGFSFTNAQETKGFVDKGNVLVSGTISYTNNFGERYAFYPDAGGKIITIQAKPQTLYFINRTIAVGGEFSITHQYFEELNISGTELGLGPKVAYFTKIGSAYPFLSAKVEYLNNAVADDVNDGLGIGLSTGIIAPFTGNAGVLIDAGYRWEKIFFKPKAQSGGTIFLGVGVGGMIISNRR